MKKVLLLSGLLMTLGFVTMAQTHPKKEHTQQVQRQNLRM